MVGAVLRVERELPANRMLANARDFRETGSLAGNSDHVHAARVCSAGVHGTLGLHEWRRRDYTGHLTHALERESPGIHLEIVAVGQHANVRTADQNLLAQVVLQSVHHADDDYQSAHADDHAGDRDDAYERQQLRSTPAPQIPPGDRQLEARHSGRRVGKRITSRMCWIPVRYMSRRSIPIPTPPVGGMPYSIARR